MENRRRALPVPPLHHEWVGWGGPLVISLLPTDVNECLTLGLCEDSECVNTRGSYLCTCRPGLLLDPSRSRCVCECREGPGWGFWGTIWDPRGPQARLRAKMPPDPRLPLHLGLGPNKPPLLCPTGMETVFRHFFEGFAVWDFLPPLFLSNHCCPICCLICFGEMCVAVISR